jgi:hypothetical protein
MLVGTGSRMVAAGAMYTVVLRNDGNGLQLGGAAGCQQQVDT